MSAPTATPTGTTPAGTGGRSAAAGDRYKWVALSNTTMAVFMSAVDGSIVIIALPAIFRGIHLDPLAPGNVAYLLWMIMGYRLVQAVLVVTLGRLGDIFGRVRIYNSGFAVFGVASVLLSFDPFLGGHGALWLIGWRGVQAIGGSMLTANSAAILTDAFPAEQRGLALGVNQIAAIAGQFIGLVAGGVLAAWDWRAVFWVNVPVGVLGTVWAYRKLRDNGERHPARIDWWGNVTFAVGLSAVLVAVTEGIQPYGSHTMSWTSPAVYGLLVGGVLLLAAFVVIEGRVAAPMFERSLFRIRAFAAGNAAGLVASVARGGLQFMLIIWLQGIWLPLHGYDYADTPLWAGIYLLPMTAAFLVTGPIAGWLSDRYGSRGLATAGMLVFAASFVGLLALPVDFPYWAFALLIVVNGIGVGVFSSPNSSAIMGSVPARHRGAASGMRSTFQNSGTALSIGVFFSLMIAGLAASLPQTLTRGLQEQGVPADVARRIGGLPPVSTLFSAVLGENPVGHLLSSQGALAGLPAAARETLTGREFFPQLISGPFHTGLVVVFAAAAVLSVLAAGASLLRGGPVPRTTAPAAGVAPPLSAPAGPAVSRQEHSMTAPAVDPARTALVLMDYQAGILERLPDADALLDRATAAIASLRAAGVTIAYVRVAFDDADLAAVPAANKLFARVAEAGGAYRSDSPATAVHDRVAPQAGDVVVRKTRVGAFSTTDLDRQLRDRGVDTLLLAGVSTSGVVLSTVRDAADRDYRLVVLADLCADPQDDVHRMLVERVFPRQADVTTSDDVVAAIG